MGFEPRIVSSASPEIDPSQFRAAMRHLAGGVTVITTGQGDARTGLTATSFSALSADPARVLVCVNRASSSYAALRDDGQFGANLLGAHQDAIAARFAGRDGISGPARYEGGHWLRLASGVFVLADALASFDCAVEEMIERHSHVIVIGKVRDIQIPDGAGALVYWRGAFDQLGWTYEQTDRAVGLAK